MKSGKNSFAFPHKMIFANGFCHAIWVEEGAKRGPLVLRQEEADNSVMSFLSLLIGTLTADLAYLLLRLWRRFKSKEKEPFFAKSDLILFFLPLAFGLILALVFLFAFPRFPWLNGSWLFLFLTLLFLWAKPAEWFSKKAGKPEKRKVVCASLIFLTLLSEAFAFNFRAYPTLSNSFTLEDPASSSLVSGSAKTNAKGELEIQNGTSLSFTFEEGQKVRNVFFDFSSCGGATITAKTFYSLDGAHYSSLSSQTFSDNNDNFAVLSLEVSGFEDVRYYRIDFSFVTNYYGADTKATLSSLSFNVPLQFHFSLLRFSSLAVCFAFFSFLPSFAKKVGKMEPGKAPYLVLGSLSTVLLLGALLYIFSDISSFATPYPISQEDLHAHLSSSTGKTDIFVSLFDAFRKGRIDLDLAVDPKLLTLQNPWSPAERSSANVSYYWDHAFYGGKYYSYYGPLPVIVASFPFYILSGGHYALTAFGLEILGMAFLVPAFLFLLFEVFRLIQQKVNYPQYIFFSCLGLITSMMIMAATWKDGVYHEAIYHVPDIYGLACFDWFFFFVLRAYRERKLRSLQLAFAGLFFVFLIFARPNLFLGLLITAPFLFAILFEKGVGAKRKIIDFAPMLGVLLVGAVLACVYNYARFDSILEFGQSYQLNVTDQRNLTYAWDKILPSFQHFFLQGGAYYNSFPYLSCTIQRYNYETTSLAPYVSSYFGMLGVPLFWAAVLLPLLFYNDSRNALKAMGFLSPAFLFLFAFTTYSKAGVCPRYLIENFHLATILGVFGLLQLREKTRSTEAGSLVAGATFGVLVLSAFLCLSLSFDSFDGMKDGSCFGLLMRIKEAFLSYPF